MFDAPPEDSIRYAAMFALRFYGGGLVTERFRVQVYTGQSTQRRWVYQS